MESIYIAYTVTFAHSHSHPCCILEIAFRIIHWLPFLHFSQGHFDGGIKERWSNYWFSILWARSTFWARVSTAAQKALKYRFHFNDSYELQILHYSKALLPKEVVIMHFQKVLWYLYRAHCTELFHALHWSVSPTEWTLKETVLNAAAWNEAGRKEWFIEIETLRCISKNSKSRFWDENDFIAMK